MKSKLLYHYCWHVSEPVHSTNEYTSRIAQIRYQAGERPSLLAAVFRAARRFVRNYLLRHAYLDGRVGLQMSILTAYSVLVTEAKLWELHYARPQHLPTDEPHGETVRLFRENLGQASSLSGERLDSCPSLTRAAS
jgi:hypothetical protein